MFREIDEHACVHFSFYDMGPRVSDKNCACSRFWLKTRKVASDVVIVDNNVAEAMVKKLYQIIKYGFFAELLILFRDNTQNVMLLFVKIIMSKLKCLVML